MAFQGTIAVESSIKNILPRIIALEEHFDSRPGDVAEHRRREELIRYAVSLSIRSGPDFLEVSSVASRGNYGCSPISGGHSGPLIVLKITKPCLVFLKIYKKPSSITRYARNRRYSQS